MKGLLLDTNVVIWVLGEERKISRRAMGALSLPGVQLVVSVVSLWEILIKRQAGKLWTSEIPDHIVELITASGAWRILPVEVAHLRSLSTLESPVGHSDPFDRLLLAQARHEGLSVVTADSQFHRYDVDVIW